jgi:hypothetical protein
MGIGYFAEAYVASALEEMEWNTQGKGIFVGHFISPVICV